LTVDKQERPLRALAITKVLLASMLRSLMGRGSFLRLARFLDYQARGDVPNLMETNGELLVQRLVLSTSGGEARIVAVDIGANVGGWSEALIDAAACVAADSQLVLHAIEPAPDSFERLRATLSNRSAPSLDIVLSQVAASDRDGTGTIYVMGRESLVNSLYERGGSRPVKVRLQTLDSYAKEHSISEITLLKIDAEGHDFNVLRGAVGLLRDQAICVAQFEYNWRWIQAGHFLKDVFDLVEPLGYGVGKIASDALVAYRGYHWELDTFHEANYLICRKDWVDRFPRIAWWGP
jgi:FkbM family methyltransferase